MSFVDRGVKSLFELVKAKDLEGLVVKRKAGKYKPERPQFMTITAYFAASLERC